MSDQIGDSPTSQNAQDILIEAQRVLDEIRQLRLQAEEHTKEAENLRKKADSEALFAFNAKGACESHSTAVANIKGQAEADLNAIAAYKKNSDELVSKLTKTDEASTELSADIQKILETAQTEKGDVSKILEHLEKSDEIATGHEVRVSELSKNLDSLIQKAEGLLPGATSAGLASAFCAQKLRFSSPQRWWLITFVLCILGLLIISVPSFWNASVGAGVHLPTWDETLHGFAVRLPIVIPLVWLAIYAGRHYMLAVRLEEDYAYKEAISTAFEGYKREMENIAMGQVTDPTPIATLCSNVLIALSERPGRIYEGKHKDITLLTEMSAAIEKVEEFRKKQLATH